MMAAKSYLSPDAYHRYQEFNEAIKMIHARTVYRDKMKNGKGISVKIAYFHFGGLDPTIRLMFDYKAETLSNRISKRKGSATHYIFE